ncbi:MAG: hypothetical protein HRU20_11625 [Pseudomonadales bacterium]|nr:hypothetical protein [Pseudomonadales bacterium]
MPLFIDIEASGFGRGSYPIEIGVVDAQSRCICHIIHPVEHWQHWDSSAEALHGIARQTLLDHGMSPFDLAQLLNQNFAGQILYTDAWGNDNSWLGLLFDEVDMYPSFKLETLRQLLNEEQVGLWHDCKQHVQDSTAFKRHRASNDAHILQMTYAQVLLLSKGYESEDVYQCVCSGVLLDS